MRVRKILNTYWFLFLIGVCVIGLGVAYFQKVKLEGNYVVTYGNIRFLEGSSKGGGVLVEYSFDINGRNYLNKTAILYSQSFFPHKFSFLVGKDLAVVYEKKLPGNSKMLFLRKEYEKFDITVSQKYDSIVKEIESIVNHK